MATRLNTSDLGGEDMRGRLVELGVVGAGDRGELSTAYGRAVERLELPIVDLLTIRDLVQLSGCRQVALQVMLLALFDARNRGSLCVPLTSPALDTALAGLSERPSDIATEFRQELDGGDYSELIGAAVADGKPVVVQGQGARRFLYLQKYLKHELQLREELGKLLNVPGPGLGLTPEQVTGIVTDVAATGAYALNTEQKRALCLALSKNFTIVSGGPGTGKTSVVVSLLRCLHRCGVRSDRVRLIAPTGRAAQRMGESIVAGLEACTESEEAKADLAELRSTTIHRLLRYNPSRNEFTHHRNNALPVDAVIVDEVSMVDVVLMARLLEALPPKALLVFLGDRHQLPSIEAGAVLGDLVPHDRKPCYSSGMADVLAQLGDDAVTQTDGRPGALEDRIVVLTESFRSRQDIVVAGDRVKTGDVTLADELPVVTPRRGILATRPGTSPVDWDTPGDCLRIEPGGTRSEGYRRVLASWLERWSGGRGLAELAARPLVLSTDDGRVAADEGAPWLEALFGALRRSQILTLVRGGPFGCTGVNRCLADRWNALCGLRTSPALFTPGTPVMVTRNDHRRELYNGDVGVALRTTDGHARVVFRRFGRFEAFPVDLLPPHELAFAITVHKSQGTEYDNVLLVLPPDPEHRLLTREVVYTGLTRARERCFIYGSADALARAIGCRIERTSGLDLWPA